MRKTNERREKVSYLLLKNIPETKIAEALGVSRQTIVRDVSILKKSSQSWLDELAKDGFIFEYKLALDKIKESGAELRRLYDQTNDVWQKIKILKEIDANSKLYLEMLGETPTISAFRKALQKDVQKS